MKIIAITVPYFFPGEAEAIESILRTGKADRVHIRKPGASAHDIRTLVESIDPALRQRLSLHDHTELAKELSVGGVHLNSRYPDVPAGWCGAVSRSLHSVTEIQKLTTEDYAFLSPVFPSISKPGYGSEMNLSELRSAINDRIYALGGVTPEKLPQLVEIGFGGAAMLGSIWCPQIGHDRFKLQFITHPDAMHGVVDGARLALEGGCRWIQLRHKDASHDTLLAEGREIATLCRQYGATFIVDDHVELVLELGADGVHLGKNDMAVDDARKILGPLKIIGATANTFADLKKAAEAGADYAGVGPFRFTTTKKNLSPMLGLKGYTAILQEADKNGIKIPIVAIGGITRDDVPAIMDTGVDGIAVSGTILSAQSPEDATEQLIETLKPKI